MAWKAPTWMKCEELPKNSSTNQVRRSRNKYARQDNEVEGYITGPALSGVQQLEWADRLRLLVAPEDSRNPKYWPESPVNFR